MEIYYTFLLLNVFFFSFVLGVFWSWLFLHSSIFENILVERKPVHFTAYLFTYIMKKKWKIKERRKVKLIRKYCMENTNKTKVVNCGAFGNIICFHRIASPILNFQSRTANKSKIPNKLKINRLNFFRNKFLAPKKLH